MTLMLLQPFVRAMIVGTCDSNNATSFSACIYKYTAHHQNKDASETIDRNTYVEYHFVSYRMPPKTFQLSVRRKQDRILSQHRQKLNPDPMEVVLGWVNKNLAKLTYSGYGDTMIEGADSFNLRGSRCHNSSVMKGINGCKSRKPASRQE
jgi:hypothetical protein